MKILIRFSVVLFLGIFFCLGAAAQDMVKIKVAVYVTGDDVEKSIKAVIGSKLVTAITSSGKYAAVERTADFLAALSRETDYQVSGEVRDSQIAKLGQRFGAKYVVVADVSEVFDELFISARMINVETGLVEKSYDANGAAESMPGLVRLSKNVATGLLKGLVNNNHKNIVGKINNREYVDLGLPSGLKWATCNLGAYRPINLGDKHGSNKTEAYLTRQLVERWGGGDRWRVPSKEDFQELIDNCEIVFEQDPAAYWIKLIGPNGSYLILPLERHTAWNGVYYSSDYKTDTYGNPHWQYLVSAWAEEKTEDCSLRVGFWEQWCSCYVRLVAR